jgi:hypothetical protein
MINFDNYLLVKIGLAIFGFLIVFPVCHFWLKYRNELRECKDKLKRQERELEQWHEYQDKCITVRLLNKELVEVLRLALNSHGIMLLSDPPKDAWKFYEVERKAREIIAKVERKKT